MILYFADRRMSIIGIASNALPKGLTIVEDKKIEEVDTGVAVLECRIAYDATSREIAENCVEVGNYLLRSYNGENQFFTIIECETDTKNQEVYFYAEDAGLDLLNELCLAYEAVEAYPISHYIEKFAYDSGFEIGINEASDLTRKLSWDGESTVAERLASVATQFDGCELSYSFDIDGLQVVKKYINIYKKRGSDTGVQLQLNREIDRIVEKKSIANLATALRVTGGTPEAEEGEETTTDPQPITLDGYTYDDGDIFLEGTYLKSRSALAVWSRYLAEDGDYTGHIMRTFTYDTTSQEELCNRAIAELKKISQIEVNYEADVLELPDHVRVGDTVTLIDDDGGLYVSTRILKMEESATTDTKKATFGDFLMKDDGINEEVAQMAEQFAKNAQSSARALELAKVAREAAVEAQTQVEDAMQSVEDAQKAIDEVADVVEEAKTSAANAQKAADDAQAVVDGIDGRVGEVETSVEEVRQAANQAKADAAAAETKASEAQAAALEAKTQSTAANEAATNATTKAENAESVAGQAKSEADAAKATAEAAKADAEQAEKDIDALGENLTTLENTMSAEYARKSELTETEASLNTKISQNAAQIQSTASKVTEVDETANNAAQQAQQAQSAADAAQQTADQATADAEAAQSAADAAALAATNAQSAADDADVKAQQAATDLATAQQNLANVTSRVDATEEEVAAAQKAVETAQAAADKAKADAITAQATADTAKTNAANAQTAADNAQQAANDAQQAADEAQEAVDSLAVRVTEAETSITQNAEAIELRAKRTEVEQIQKNLDDLEVGGRNLYQGTKLYDGDKWLRLDQWQEWTESTYKDFAIRTKSTAWGGLCQLLDVKAGEIYTLSAYAKAASDLTVAAYFASNNSFSSETPCTASYISGYTRTIGTEWTRIVAVAKVESDGVMAARFEGNADVQWWICGLKLEKGNKATDWTPAPEDYMTKEETAAAIKVEADRISSVVETVDGQGERLSTVEQTADGLSVELQNLEIGGRNLLLGTRGFNVTGNRWTGWLNHASFTFAEDDDGFVVASKAASGLIEDAYQSCYSNVIKAETGDVLIFSCWFKVDDVSALDNRKVYIFETFSEDGNRVAWDDCSLDRSLTEELVSGEWVRLVSRHTVSYEGENLNCGLRLCLFKNGSIHFKKCKLEKGNRATDWTPAPEDQDKATEEAAKTATNFLTFSDEWGLEVGNRQDGSWHGTRTQMLSDSFNILAESGVQLASYGANKIELGKNSQDTEIDFCNGLMELKYSSKYNAASLSSSNGSLVLYAENTDTDGNRVYSEVQALQNGLSLASSLSADGFVVDDYSQIWLSKGQGRWDSSEYIMMTAPIINVTGDFGVDGSIDATDSITIDPGGTSYVPFVSKRKISSTDYSADFGVGNPATGEASAMLRLLNSSGTTLSAFNLRDDGATLSTGNMYAPNGFVSLIDYGLYVKNSSNATREVVKVYSSGPTYSFGYGGYSNSEGKSQIYGNNIVLRAKGTIYLQSDDNTGASLVCQYISNKASIYPSVNNGGYCGGANYRWAGIYSATAVSVSSDCRLKNSISDDFGKLGDFFDRLRPVSFRLNDDESGKLHIGFVAQDVEKALNDSGYDATTFAALMRDAVDPDADPDGLFADGYSYSLGYTEFIALNTAMIQKLMRKVTALEEEIQRMKGETV